MHRAKLAKFCNGRHHQNVVLKCSKIGYTDVRSIKDILDLNVSSEQANTQQGKPAVTGKFYLFLDQVTDPQNFGSILRSAMFIGVDGIIVNRRNACGLTPVVSKVSSGALEFIPLYSVKFLSHFFDDAKKPPYNFKIISTNLADDEGRTNQDGGKDGAANDGHSDFEEDDVIGYSSSEGDEDEIKFGDMDSELNNSSGLTPLDQLRLPLGSEQNVILVLGAEGEGVSRTIGKSADYRVVIPP